MHKYQTLRRRTHWTCRVAPRLARLGCLAILAGGLALTPAASLAQQPAPAPPARQQQIPIPLIRTNTTLVEIPVLVLNKQGEPMLQLGKDDFEVYDNGELQRVTGFDNESRPVSLAIIVDTSDEDAIGQARRSARLITDMVLGTTGQAAIYVPGPEPRQILPFTTDTTQITNALTHLSPTPAAPQGEGSVLEPLNLAMMALRHQTSDRTRAALIISRSDARAGAGAQALLESGMSEAIPIFRISPNRPAGMPDLVNPNTPEQRGIGQGSQRVIRPAAPTGPRGQPTSDPGAANIDLGGVVRAASGMAGRLLDPRHMNYVFATGGMSYSAGNDHEFDQRLSLIGEELHDFYHLYYSPNNLTPTAEVHAVTVKVSLPATSNIGSTTYRRSYLGVKPR